MLDAALDVTPFIETEKRNIRRVFTVRNG